MKLLTESGRTKMNMSDDDYASKAFLYLPAAVVHGSTLLSRPPEGSLVFRSSHV